MRTRDALEILLATTLVTACSGGGGGGSGPRGVFLDSAVSGVDYSTSGGGLGMTDANGSFSYGAGQSVLFSIGDVVLGVATGAAIVTPVDLVPGATDESDEAVINIARFLQTLDLDLDPENGIEVTDSVRLAAVGVTIDFTQSVANFETGEQAAVDTLTAGLPGGSRMLIPAMDAEAHLADTLRSIVAGRYDGTYSGDSSGSFHVFVDRSGSLFGWADDIFDGPLELTGDADTAGGFVAGNASSGATFTGTIGADGSLAGTWQLAFEAGTFQGTRTVSVANDLDEDLIDMLAGIYLGTINAGVGSGPFAASLNGDGNLSLPPPDNQLSGTIVSTSGTTANFCALAVEGTEFTGTVTLAGSISGTFVNGLTNLNGSFSGTRR